MARVTFIMAALVIALVSAFSNQAAAQFETHDRTILTFSGPVEMPGIKLQAGTYVFKLADTLSRNVVEVWDEEEEHMIGHWLFVPAQRAEASDDTVIMFKETAAGTTPAVRYWYYPGERIGKEFVYPKNQAIQIAARTNETVLTADGEITDEPKVSSVDATGTVTAWTPEEVEPAPQAGVGPDTIDGTGVVTQQARADVEPAPVVAPEPAPRSQASTGEETAVDTREELPQTASPLALSALIGMLALAGSAGVRFLR